ncbi:hypothetical protein K8I31_20895, partial [bacterium]|nr:hypothetical protein [bacterium]
LCIYLWNVFQDKDWNVRTIIKNYKAYLLKSKSCKVGIDSQIYNKLPKVIEDLRGEIEKLKRFVLRICA